MIRGWSLGVPRAHPKILTLTEDGRQFPVHRIQRVHGTNLSTCFLLPMSPEQLNSCSDLYEGLLAFIAQYHGDVRVDIGQETLRTYYKRRLHDLSQAMTHIAIRKEEYKDKLKPFILLAQILARDLNEGIEPDELMLPVHGDFRPNNILVDFDQRQAWIIDFEQGLLGGDWFVDLWKMGLFSSTPAKMAPMLTHRLQQKLLEVYSQSRRTFLSRVTIGLPLSENPILRYRTNLARFDLLVSFFVLRYLMGWHFEEKKDPRGIILRGDRFILNLLTPMATGIKRPT
ncbi:MAG: aminoglycoside phosphotransferase family protein [Candidatus Komeilibacteria bacterium]